MCPAVAVVAVWAAAAQTLVEPERLAAAREAFQTAGKSPQLRCEIKPVRPALNYGFRFQTGYVIDVPLNQFQGSGHDLTVFLQVVPDSREATYLSSQQALPEVPATALDGEFTGRFVVGEGNYAVDALVQDDLGRACYSKWRIQARRTGRERELKPTTPAAAVEELSGGGRREAEPAPGEKIERLTILLHAAPLAPDSSKLQPGDVDTLVESLAALLQQLPALSVRLVVFNLDQQAVLLRKVGFVAHDLEQVAQSLEQLQLALVDYRTLQKGDLLSDLVQGELRTGKPADAIVFLGPHTRTQEISAQIPDQRPAMGALFYLQYRRQPMLPRMAGRGPAYAPNTPDSPWGNPTPVMVPVGPDQPGRPVPDTIEQLVQRWKGQTIAIKAPHDFAEAIRLMAGRIRTVHAPPAPPPVLAGKVASPAASVPARSADPDEVLLRLRGQVREHAARIPNYTCVETIQRERYEPSDGRSAKSCDALLAARKVAGSAARLRLDLSDRLRLDVAVADGREIYSWAGASKFEEGEIDELVPPGAIGTGPFATMLLSVFGSRGPRFTFEGDTTVDGLRLFEYSVRVPWEESYYRVKTHHNDWVITGYSGTLLVDPRTAELVRFTVRTDELPPDTDSCEVDTTLTYGIVPLAGLDYLLPTATRQRFIGTAGAEAENGITFAACREYRGESTLTFGSRPATRAGEPAALSPVPLPPGLPVSVELTTPIPFDQAAAGDRILGRLAEPIRGAQWVMLAPAGAIVEGRLMRLETRPSRGAGVTVALRWETVEVNGVKVPLSLLPNRQILRVRGMEIALPPPGTERYAFFHFSEQRTGVDRGLRTEWLTAQP
ncbi:conserved hypothetical protein [Candidatus Sulfopaludibacter sp. SbA3]|nr:conserved hypothetical protein [Candidatus Sulfopaludibacter sp. SbA3]